MNYGIGYMGSKSKIAKQIIDSLPPADTFVDLFCGGGAITHCAMLSGKYKNFIINDIDELIVDCLIKAFNGEYKDEKRWISREDFFELKDTDPYVKFCWSFGNRGDTYLYGNIEPYKKACHYAVVFDDWVLFDKLCPEVSDVAKESVKDITDTKQRRLLSSKAIVKELKRIGDIDLVMNNPLYKSCYWRKGFNSDSKNQGLEMLQSLQRLERLEGLGSSQRLGMLENLERLQRLGSLESLQRLERLQSLEKLQRLGRLENLEILQRLQSLEGLERLERLQRLKSYVGDYQNVIIPDNSVIYCDIPYKNTTAYTESKSFDYDRFYSWAEKQIQPIFISEYGMPEDRFECVKQIEKRSLLSDKGNNKVMIEKLYIPRTSKHIINKEPEQLWLF